MNVSKLKLAGIVVAFSSLVAWGKETAKAVTMDPVQQAEVEQLLGKYEVALNSGSVPAVLQVYSTDPVVMTAEHPAAVGSAAVEGFYTATFKAIGLNLKFKIAEVKPLGTDWA